MSFRKSKMKWVSSTKKVKPENHYVAILLEYPPLFPTTNLESDSHNCTALNHPAPPFLRKLRGQEGEDNSGRKEWRKKKRKRGRFYISNPEKQACYAIVGLFLVFNFKMELCKLEYNSKSREGVANEFISFLRDIGHPGDRFRCRWSYLWKQRQVSIQHPGRTALLFSRSTDR